MRIKTLVALYFWILEFDDVTCIRSIDKFKNLANDRTVIYKQPYKDLDLCEFSYVSYSEKRFNQIYRALYGDAMLVSLRGTPIWRP